MGNEDGYRAWWGTVGALTALVVVAVAAGFAELGESGDEPWLVVGAVAVLAAVLRPGWARWMGGIASVCFGLAAVVVFSLEWDPHPPVEFSDRMLGVGMPGPVATAMGPLGVALAAGSVVLGVLRPPAQRGRWRQGPALSGAAAAMVLAAGAYGIAAIAAPDIADRVADDALAHTPGFRSPEVPPASVAEGIASRELQWSGPAAGNAHLVPGKRTVVTCTSEVMDRAGVRLELSARDSVTGQVRWTVAPTMQNLDYCGNVTVDPGTDRVIFVQGEAVVELDLDTGRLVGRFALPPSLPGWNVVSGPAHISHGYLVVSSSVDDRTTVLAVNLTDRTTTEIDQAKTGDCAYQWVTGAQSSDTTLLRYGAGCGPVQLRALSMSDGVVRPSSPMDLSSCKTGCELSAFLGPTGEVVLTIPVDDRTNEVVVAHPASGRITWRQTYPAVDSGTAVAAGGQLIIQIGQRYEVRELSSGTLRDRSAPLGTWHLSRTTAGETGAYAVVRTGGDWPQSRVVLIRPGAPPQPVFSVSDDGVQLLAAADGLLLVSLVGNTVAVLG